jgi:hypothetical protein
MLNSSKASSSSNDVYFYDDQNNLWHWHRLRHELTLVGWGVEFTGTWARCRRWLVREGCLDAAWDAPIRWVSVKAVNAPLSNRLKSSKTA